MFRFDSAERTNREPAPGVSLQVFDVGSGSVAGFLERLHRAVAIFATHDFSAFCERFEDRAWKPAPPHLHLALRHHRRFFFVATEVFGCLQTSCRHRFLSTLKPKLELSARQSGEGYRGKVMISRHVFTNVA